MGPVLFWWERARGRLPEAGRDKRVCWRKGPEEVGKMAGLRVMGIVLAGAEGKRLAPLTADRAKSAVPFGGLYRLVDFALSNLTNGDLLHICVLTQYKSHSLDRHIPTPRGQNPL